jgi:hypothetical protein
MPSTHAKESLHDTRQLLDELDALMDQMLALPIDDQDEAVTSPVTTPTVSATLTLLEAGPGAAPAGMDGVDLPAPPRYVEPVPAPIIGAVAALTSIELTPLPPPLRTARWRPSRLAYQFLLWTNQGFDYGTTWLGPAGRFLRSGAGKALLGSGGLILLALALAWLGKDWLGWNW